MHNSIEKLDIGNPEGLKSWHKRFHLYCLTNPKITPANKVAFYLTLAGKEAYDLLTDLLYPEDVEKHTVVELEETLTKHLCPVNFETVERAKFHKITRQTEEKLKDFLLRLQHQAAKCNFGAQLEIQLRDRVVAGVCLPKVERKLLAEQKLTFQRVKEILENYDNVNESVGEDKVLFSKKHSFHKDQRSSSSSPTGT